MIQIALTIVGVAIIGGMKYYQRKYGNDPEAWDTNKFLMFIGVAMVIMAGEYLYGNEIAFPAEDVIVPAMALFGTAYTVITAGKLGKNVAIKTNLISPATVSISQPVSTPSYGGWTPGFTVMPAFSKGVSPYIAKLFVSGGNLPETEATGKRCGLRIDWMDGSPVQDFVLDSVTGMANVEHVYKYEKGASKYTGHSFYPIFKMVMPDGTFKEFNTTDKRACEVEVQSA